MYHVSTQGVNERVINVCRLLLMLGRHSYCSTELIPGLDANHRACGHGCFLCCCGDEG